MTDEELISTLWSGEVTLSTVAAAAVRIKELMRNLKSVLEREAETQARHDTKIDALEAKLAKAVDVIKHLINIAPEGDEDEWHIALDDAAEALAKIKGKTK